MVLSSLKGSLRALTSSALKQNQDNVLVPEVPTPAMGVTMHVGAPHERGHQGTRAAEKQLPPPRVRGIAGVVVQGPSRNSP